MYALRSDNALWSAEEEDSIAHAVNREYAGSDRALVEGDEVALIPPVSGGSAASEIVVRVALTTDPIDVGALRASVGSPAAGAVVVFEGVTRSVPRLLYEAYNEMAAGVLEKIAREVAAKHGVEKIAIEHRTGSVPLGETSVAIAVSGAHRDETFVAARGAIDAIKSEAPIWKKEHPEQDRDGTWVEGTPARHRRSFDADS